MLSYMSFRMSQLRVLDSDDRGTRKREKSLTNGAQRAKLFSEFSLASGRERKELHADQKGAGRPGPHVTHANLGRQGVALFRHLDGVHAVRGQRHRASQERARIVQVHHLGPLAGLERSPQIADHVQAHVRAPIADSTHACLHPSSVTTRLDPMHDGLEPRPTDSCPSPGPAF